MNSEGHFGLVSLLISPVILLLSVTVSHQVVLVFVVLTLICTGIPDIDYRLSRSIVGNLTGIEHRGFTHTIYFAFIMGFVTLSFGSAIDRITYLGYFSMFLSGFLGITGHVLGDVLTPAGINYIPPVQQSAFSLDWFNYNNMFGNLGALFVGSASLSLSLSTVYGDPVPVIYYVGLYFLLLPTAIIVAKRTNIRYNTGFISRYFSPFWWIKRLI